MGNYIRKMSVTMTTIPGDYAVYYFIEADGFGYTRRYFSGKISSSVAILKLLSTNRNRLTDFENKRERLVGGRDKSGAWDEHIHTTVYKIDNQQGPTVEHRELYSIFCNNLNGKRI